MEGVCVCSHIESTTRSCHPPVGTASSTVPSSIRTPAESTILCKRSDRFGTSVAISHLAACGRDRAARSPVHVAMVRTPDDSSKSCTRHPWLEPPTLHLFAGRTAAGLAGRGGDDSSSACLRRKGPAFEPPTCDLTEAPTRSLAQHPLYRHSNNH